MNEQPKKKKHSLWWIWLILILVAFGGGIVTGLKLNTLPLPSEVQGKLYPILESYIPGSTKTREQKTGAETPVPEANAEPEETALPAVTAAPETPKPEEIFQLETPKPEETVPTETPKPVETELFEMPKPEESNTPLEPKAAAPVESLAPVGTELTNEGEQSGFELSETTAFAAEPQAVKYIGVNKALEIAMQNANPGERKAEVTGVYRTKDDDGNPVYEVSFTIDEIGYDYVIDAVSGEIMSWRLSGLSYSETFAFGGEEMEPAALQ